MSKHNPYGVHLRYNPDETTCYMCGEELSDDKVVTQDALDWISNEDRCTSDDQIAMASKSSVGQQAVCAPEYGPINETYIGDGVYASFDGYQIWLRTQRFEGSRQDEIALEPAVFAALIQYAIHINAKRQQKYFMVHDVS